jgi:hypothetical protein
MQSLEACRKGAASSGKRGHDQQQRLVRLNPSPCSLFCPSPASYDRLGSSKPAGAVPRPGTR